MSKSSRVTKIFLACAVGIVAVSGMTGVGLAFLFSRSVLPMSIAAGDALVFPGIRPPRYLDQTVIVRAIRVEDDKPCVMDPRVMAARGGSLFVTDRSTDGKLTLHWQDGGGTGSGDLLVDCGNGIDLQMHWSDVALLVLQAGRHVRSGFNP